MAITVGSVTVNRSFPAWAADEAVTAGDKRSNAGKVFEAATSGTTGENPPQHIEGTESDGAVDWTYDSDHLGAVSKSGAAAAVFDSLVASTEAANPGIAPLKYATKLGIADIANAVAAAVQHIKDNAQARITTSDSGLQRDPSSGDPTDAPSSDKLIDVE